MRPTFTWDIAQNSNPVLPAFFVETFFSLDCIITIFLYVFGIHVYITPVYVIKLFATNLGQLSKKFARIFEKDI